MRKSLKWSILLVFAAYIASCTVDAYDTTSTRVKEKDEDKPLSETYSVIPEGNNCLNVVYYIPSDMDTISLWHKRLSGITLEMQAFFKKNMQRYRYDKTFGLVVNDSNKTYIVVDYIKSKRTASQLKIENVNHMTSEILEYYKTNPSAKRSNHFLVYMPTYDGSFINCAFANPSGAEVPDHAFAFAGCDHEKFNPKFFDSARGLKAYLPDMGEVMYELAHAFFLTDNNGPYAASQYALTGRIGNTASKGTAGSALKWNKHYANYWKYATDDPDKINLTEVDAKWLDQIQVFNKKEEHVYKPISATIEDVKLRYDEEENTIYVDCAFRSEDEIVAVIAYNDPWRTLTNPITTSTLLKEPQDSELNRNEFSRTGGDAMAYVVDAERFRERDGLYWVSFVMPWEDLHTSNTAYTYMDNTIKDDPNTPLKERTACCDAEIRFRFIGKGGMACPHPSVSIKGEWGSKFRWPYRIRFYYDTSVGYSPGLSVIMPDINELYGDTGE